MCRPRLIDSAVLKAVYIQVKIGVLIYMYMVLGGNLSLKVSKLYAETVEAGSWYQIRMTLGKKE